jgi:hypothetical protein
MSVIMPVQTKATNTPLSANNITSEPRPTKGGQRALLAPELITDSLITVYFSQLVLMC